jgi:glucan 1,4-alpha-maltotetraohydrolase
LQHCNYAIPRLLFSIFDERSVKIMAERGDGRDIILQAFHWNLVKTRSTGTIDGCPESWYAILTRKAGEIAGSGFTIAYLPPPWRDDSDWECNGKHGGGEGYFWHDFDLDSRYGTKAELKGLVSALHGLGIKVIVDLVTNHRDRARMQRDVWTYPGPHWFNGGDDDGGLFMDGSADLALDNPEVSARIVAAMDELMDDCGIDGWRWDYVWGYAVEDVVKWIKQTRREEYISIGEYWQSSPNLSGDPMIRRYGPDEGARILGWSRDSGGLAFDIILKRQINTADPANLKYGLNTRPDAAERARVVTFVDNHDMGPSPFSPANGWGQQCWPCPVDFKSKAYAFILTMPGTPCVYWPDCFDWGFGGEIASLIAARKKAGIVAGSTWQDLTGSHTGFAGIVRNGAGEDALALSIGSNYSGPGDGWEKAAEKAGEWTVWIKH